MIVVALTLVRVAVIVLVPVNKRKYLFRVVVVVSKGSILSRL